MRTKISRCATIALLLGSGAAAPAQSDPNRGLWVGQITLNHANEVVVPLDENNNPVAPVPKVPTPTFDAANLRVILHVNGAGQVRLLRDVALVRRKPGELGSESDIALLTDERLYGEFPPQPAQRIASAVFDFGDARATGAVDAVVEAAISAAAAAIAPLTQANLSTAAGREAAEEVLFAAALTPATAEIPKADAAVAFSNFLSGALPQSAVDALAAGGDPATVRTAAAALEAASFYADGRGNAMLDAVLAAVAAATAGGEQLAARTAAAAFADTDNAYHRFIAGEQIGDMITAAAAAAGTAAAPLAAVAITELTGSAGAAPIEVTAVAHGLQNGARVVISDSTLAALNGSHVITSATADSFEITAPFAAVADDDALGYFVAIDTLASAVENDPTGLDAEAEALRIQVAAYSDTRAVAAIAAVRAAMIAAAEAATSAAGRLSPELRERRVREAVFAAGREALATDVARFALPEGAPGGDYTEFVRSDIYADSPENAARAVAVAMIEEKAGNVLATPASINGQGRAAAYRALDAVYSSAARSSQTTLAMRDGAAGGGFGAGKGDARLTAEIGGSDALAGPALSATLVLPASHPTNPFRHRRHPDHTRGFDITREIRLDFDAEDPSPSPRASYGVDRLSGVYREEIFGLHKPLGPDPEGDPVGLRVEGRFEIFRISLIDALDAR